MTTTDENPITVIRIPLIWLDRDINEESCKDMRKKLRDNFGRCHFVQNNEEYQHIVKPGLLHVTYVLIVSGQLGVELKDSFPTESKISAIYVYCQNVEGHKKWADNISKVNSLRLFSH